MPYTDEELHEWIRGLNNAAEEVGWDALPMCITLGGERPLILTLAGNEKGFQQLLNVSTDPQVSKSLRTAEAVAVIEEGWMHGAKVRDVMQAEKLTVEQSIERFGMPAEHPEREEVRMIVVITKDRRLIMASQIRGEELVIDPEATLSGRGIEAIQRAVWG